MSRTWDALFFKLTHSSGKDWEKTELKLQTIIIIKKRELIDRIVAKIPAAALIIPDSNCFNLAYLKQFWQALVFRNVVSAFKTG